MGCGCGQIQSVGGIGASPDGLGGVASVVAATGLACAVGGAVGGALLGALVGHFGMKDAKKGAMYGAGAGGVLYGAWCAYATYNVFDMTPGGARGAQAQAQGEKFAKLAAPLVPAGVGFKLDMNWLPDGRLGQILLVVPSMTAAQQNDARIALDEAFFKASGGDEVRGERDAAISPGPGVFNYTGQYVGTGPS